MSLTKSWTWFNNRAIWWDQEKNYRYNKAAEYRVARDKEKQKKEKYVELSAKCSELVPLINEMATSFETAGGYLENVILVGTSYDNGLLKRNATDLREMSNNFEILRIKCDAFAYLCDQAYDDFERKRKKYYEGGQTAENHRAYYRYTCNNYNYYNELDSHAYYREYNYTDYWS